MKMNHHYEEISQSYLFSTVAKKAADFQKKYPDREMIKLSIGDVTLPLAGAVIKALHGAVDEMGKAETFRGYGPEQGYAFLQEAIAKYYAGHGVQLDPNEIFVSDGA